MTQFWPRKLKSGQIYPPIGSLARLLACIGALAELRNASCLKRHANRDGASPSGKAVDFDSTMRRFESSRPSHFQSNQVPRGLARAVACALAGSSGQGCLG